MRNPFLFLVTAIFAIAIQWDVRAIEVLAELPLETAILKLPDNSERNFKELRRQVSSKFGKVETVPIGETNENWSKLIFIQFHEREDWEKNEGRGQDPMKWLQKGITCYYSANGVMWNVIEEADGVMIYEWMLQKPSACIPIMHEIGRLCLTDGALHQVGFTKKSKKMSSKERENCIAILKEHFSVLPFEQADSSMGLSLVEKMQSSFNLTDDFQSWVKLNHFSFDNGCAIASYIPQENVGLYVIECLEIFTMPNLHSISLIEMFEREKKHHKERTFKNVKFDLLEKTSSELTYCYSYPHDGLQTHVVTRICRTDQGIYSMTHKRGLKGLMKREEILKIKGQLKMIRVNADNDI